MGKKNGGDFLSIMCQDLLNIFSEADSARMLVYDFIHNMHVHHNIIL